MISCKYFFLILVKVSCITARLTLTTGFTSMHYIRLNAYVHAKRKYVISIYLYELDLITPYTKGLSFLYYYMCGIYPHKVKGKN